MVKPSPGIQAGDVFSVPVANAGHAIGVVRAARLPEVFVIIFDGLHAATMQDAVRALESCRPILAGLTLTAKFELNHWHVLGRVLSREINLAEPCFEVPRHGKKTFEDTAARVIEHPPPCVTPARRITVAPVRFEHALRSLHMGEPWCEHYDVLTVDNYYH